MEKQAYLPIKFYPVKEWQEFSNLQISGDYTIVKEYNNIPPAFQMVLPNIGRHWDRKSFLLGTFELVNYDTAATYDLNAASYSQLPVMYSSGNGFRTLVYRRFPAIATSFAVGRYYYHLVEMEGDSEWFSEVFELCDLGLDALIYNGQIGFDGETGFASFVSDYVVANRMADITFCKSGTGAYASAYMPVEVFLEEELDLYIQTSNRTGTCGGTDKDWDNPVFFFLRTSDDVLISDICRVDTTNTLYHFKLKAESGGTVRLYMYIKAGDATEGDMWVGLYRTHTESHVQMRWSDDKNFCKIVYDQEPLLSPFLYENIYFFKTKSISSAITIDENSIEETVVEDDASNKYRIIGTNQKWNSISFAGSECFLNAMSLLRLHKYVELIKENGEPFDIVDLLLEQSVIADHASSVKLTYREESCSADVCGFEVCCPTEGSPTIIGTFPGGGLPAAADFDGQWAMLFNLGAYLLYLSNGATWNLTTAFRIAGNCLEVQNYLGADFAFLHASGSQTRFYHTANTSTNWYPVMSISSVADATGGQATVNINATYWFGSEVWCQVEYYTGSDWEIPLPFHIDEQNWIPVIEKENLATQTGARVLTATCGGGTFYFRVHIWDGDCDMGYCIPVVQTIS